MRCDRWSVPVFASLAANGLPLDHEIPCRLLLKDRFDNPVGRATQVGFRTEAGQIDRVASSAPATPHPVDGGGPNGRWDGDTVIWTETRLAWTGAPDLDASQPVLRGCEPPEGVDCGVQEPVYALHVDRPCLLGAHIADSNLNCVSGASCELALEGGALVPPHPVPAVHDSLCMDWRLQRVADPEHPLREQRVPSFGGFDGGRTC